MGRTSVAASAARLDRTYSSASLSVATTGRARGWMRSRSAIASGSLPCCSLTAAAPIAARGSRGFTACAFANELGSVLQLLAAELNIAERHQALHVLRIGRNGTAQGLSGLVDSPADEQGFGPQPVHLRDGDSRSSGPVQERRGLLDLPALK